MVTHNEGGKESLISACHSIKVIAKNELTISDIGLLAP